MRTLCAKLIGFFAYLIPLYINPFSCVDYTVIKISGRVEYQNKLLKLGDQIDITHRERISFGKDASIQVCSPNCQPASFEISQTRQNSLSNLVSSIRAQLGFSSKPRLTARRGEDYQSLQQWFAASVDPSQPNPFLIIGQGEYLVQFKQFVQSSNQSFCLKYTYQEQTIYKKLPNINNRILMSHKYTYTVDGKAINVSDVSNMELVYLDTKTKQETYVCRFRPVFVEPNVLLNDLTPIIDAVASQTSSNDLYDNYVLPFVLYNYGVPDNKTLKGLIIEKFNISFH